ncbi:MAG: hypothetical protein QM582_14550 [Micropruina sp.]|uniref:hypothetical protein n=1 Tax=Micropruina sp. TaxID=2737536 RepID=UPI0039E5A922
MTWPVIAAALGTIASLGYLVNGNIRYEVGVVRVSGYSAAETFTHRPIVFRLLSAAQSWLPELASSQAGPAGSWTRVWVFEAGFRLVAAGLAAAAASLLWLGLRRRTGSMAWAYALAVYAALVFTAPATGEPDWMAALLAVAAVGAGLTMRPGFGGAIAGVLLALAALVKISTAPMAAAALLILWAIDHRRGWIATLATATAGLLGVGLIGWLAPFEIGWLLDIRALQPDPWTWENATAAGHYLMNLAARWPVVTLLPAYFVGVRRGEGRTACAGLVLTALGVVYQGQYFIYHGIGVAVLSAVLAVRTVARSRAGLRWPLLVLSVWTLVLFVLPAAWRVEHWIALYLVTGCWAFGLAAGQWLALRRPATRSEAASTVWAAGLVLVSMLATQTPVSAESLTLKAAGRTSWAEGVALRGELEHAEQIHRLVGADTRVAYLAFGDTSYLLGNPTRCRYPSALFLQRDGADRLVSAATRAESLGCLTDPEARWLVWDRNWLHRKGAPDDLLATIDENWACESAAVVGGYTLCPRRTG